MFRDVMPLMTGGRAFKETCGKVIDFIRSVRADVIVDPESRGFIFGCLITYELGIGFVPVRKPGKLPGEIISVSYDLKYGNNRLCVHRDDVKKGQRVLIMDNLLTTSGTVDATIQIIQGLGGGAAGCTFLVEFAGLKGRGHLKDFNVFSLVSYE